MKLVLSLLVASAVLTRASGLQERAITCDAILPSMNADSTRATAFCKGYLQISPRTITQTSTVTRATVTVSQPIYTTTVLSVTPNTSTKSKTQTQTQTVQVTPSTKTYTQTITSTAYLDADGSTIAVMKRSEPTPAKVELAARSVVTPSYLKGLSKADIRAACQCMNIATPTFTVQKTAAATATLTKVLNRKVIKTTTLAAPVVSTTIQATRLVTVTAAAPKATVLAYEVDTYNGCPPTDDTTWVCPDQTGDDNGSDPNYETCAVYTDDGYSGYCVYWADDGSPAGSTLTLGDGSGDPDDDETRDAVYGDDDTDDCPSWADWTCSPSAAASKRSVLVARSQEFEFQKRGFVPKRVSPAAHRKAGKAKMPKGLARGGKYVAHPKKGISLESEKRLRGIQ